MPIDLNDDRLKNVENEKNNAINETKSIFDNQISDSEKYYQAQIDASKEYQKTQTNLQKVQLEQNVKEIEQNKEKTEKDYLREQKGAYSDYQKVTNQYGVKAEKLAMQGLNQTGYSESTKTNAYNTYQNRYATARESYNNAIQNYNNLISQAKIQNSSALAQIAYQALQRQLELSLDGFQYKNALIQTKQNAINQEKDRYDNKYQQVLNQLNTEASLAEQQRQFNEEMELRKQQKAQEQANWEREYALRIVNSRKSSGSSGSRSSSSKSYTNNSVNNTVNYEVNTPYYQGDLNPDAKNGTFSNGYQPDNVGGKRLKKTGETIPVFTQTLNGEEKTVEQNIWKTPDGKKWLWDGKNNKYVEY